MLYASSLDSFSSLLDVTGMVSIGQVPFSLRFRELSNLNVLRWLRNNVGEDRRIKV